MKSISFHAIYLPSLREISLQPLSFELSFGMDFAQERQSLVLQRLMINKIDWLNC